jgi:RNA polymerase sigma-70 factor, ECF subfamily
MPSTSADRDKADVEQTLAGNPAAFSGIVERWQKPLINLAFRFCRNQGEAEDMAQDAFVRAFRSLGQWRQEAAFSTWLFALSLNVFRSHRRRAPPTAVPLDDQFSIVGTQPNPESSLAMHEHHKLVRRAVTTLPPRYRDALILFYFMEQDVAQAASCLGVPVGTLKARLHRGRELLKIRLVRSVKLDQRL